jgi:hypothetical protein
MGIARHDHGYAGATQLIVQSLKVFVADSCIGPARESRVTYDSHDELATTSLKCTHEPSRLAVVNAAHYPGVDCEQRKSIGLQFKKRGTLRSNFRPVETA